MGWLAVKTLSDTEKLQMRIKREGVSTLSITDDIQSRIAVVSKPKKRSNRRFIDNALDVLQDVLDIDEYFEILDDIDLRALTDRDWVIIKDDLDNLIAQEKMMKSGKNIIFSVLNRQKIERHTAMYRRFLNEMSLNIGVSRRLEREVKPCERKNSIFDDSIFNLEQGENELNVQSLISIVSAIEIDILLLSEEARKSFKKGLDQILDNYNKEQDLSVAYKDLKELRMMLILMLMRQDRNFFTREFEGYVKAQIEDFINSDNPHVLFVNLSISLKELLVYGDLERNEIINGAFLRAFIQVLDVACADATPFIIEHIPDEFLEVAVKEMQELLGSDGNLALREYLGLLISAHKDKEKAVSLERKMK